MGLWREQKGGVMFEIIGDLDVGHEFIKTGGQYFNAMQNLNKDTPVWFNHKNVTTTASDVVIYVQNVYGSPKVTIYANAGRFKEKPKKRVVRKRVHALITDYVPYLVAFSEFQTGGEWEEDVIATPIGFMLFPEGVFDGAMQPFMSFDTQEDADRLEAKFHSGEVDSGVVYIDVPQNGISGQYTLGHTDTNTQTQTDPGLDYDHTHTTWIDSPFSYPGIPGPSGALTPSATITGHGHNDAWYGCTDAHTGECVYGSYSGNAYMSNGLYNSFYAADFNYYGLLYTYGHVSGSGGGKRPTGGQTYKIDAAGNRIPISNFHFADGSSQVMSGSGSSIVKVTGEDHVLYSGQLGYMDLSASGVNVSAQYRWPAGNWDPKYLSWSYGGEILPQASFSWGDYGGGQGAFARYEALEEFILGRNMWYSYTLQKWTDDGYATRYITNVRDLEEYPVISGSGENMKGNDYGVMYWYLDEDRQICMYTYQRKWVPLGLTLNCWPEGDPDRSPPVPDGHHNGPHPRVLGTGEQTDYGEAPGPYAVYALGNILGWGIVYEGDGWPEHLRGNHVREESVPVTQSTNNPRFNTGVEMPDNQGAARISFNKGLCKRMRIVSADEGDNYDMAG